jgi:F-type H+-transporting ATPase subunit alpha
MPVAEQVASIYSGTAGYLDRIKTDRVTEFLADLIDRLHAENKDLIDRINESGQLSDEDEEALGKTIEGMVDDFGPDFDQEGNPLEEGESDRIKDEEHRRTPSEPTESEEQKSEEPAVA